jgi:hypothetical protein
MGWNTNVIEEFRANEGKVGGNFEGRTLLLLHTTGRKSGEERINPLAYNMDGDRYVVFATKGGHDYHPHWMLNVGSALQEFTDECTHGGWNGHHERCGGTEGRIDRQMGGRAPRNHCA